MTTSLEQLIGKRGEHNVGYFTSIVEPRQLDGGAKCDKDIDNFELVTITVGADDEDNVFHITPLENETDRGYIVYSSEVLHLGDYETKLDFYNGEGTMARIFYQEPLTSFKVSHYEVVDSGKTEEDVVKGWYAYYVPGTEDKPAHYALTETKPTGKANTYRVIQMVTEEEYELLGLQMVELLIEEYHPTA